MGQATISIQLNGWRHLHSKSRVSYTVQKLRESHAQVSNVLYFRRPTAFERFIREKATLSYHGHMHSEAMTVSKYFS